MVLTLPMVATLKEINPNSQVFLFANKYTEPLLKNQSSINKYIFIDDVKTNLVKTLKELNLDIIFFPHPRFNEIFAAFKAKVPIRVGSGYRWYSIFLNHKVFEHRKNGIKNEAEYNLSLISSITKENYQVKLLRPFISEESSTKVESILQNNKINDSRFIIIHPGGGDSAPKWPPHSFGEFAKQISIRTNYKVIITGTESEIQLCNEVNKIANQAINFCNLLNLYEMIALIDRSEIVITNSTGVIHIAAALDKKILGFYPNSPNIGPTRWGPMNNKKIILTPQANLNKNAVDDLSLITVEDALAAFSKLDKF
jgi:heptosyltransferase-2